MSTPVNVTLIGAGSAQFSLALLKDLVLTESLNGSQLTLMDIDIDRLEIVAGLVRRYAGEFKSALRIRTTTDLKDALRGADFVINTALAGGHPAEEAERKLAEKHGYYRGLRVLHMQKNLDLMLTIARTMEEVCPAAWLIEAANPVFEGCTLMTRETSIKIVGLCHGYQGYLRVADVLGLDPMRITWEAPGFNHIIYLTEFRYDNESIYPILDKWIAEKSEKYWSETDFLFHDTDLSRAAIEEYKRLGYLPLGDTTRGMDHWWYNTDLETKKHWWGARGGFDSEFGWWDYLDRLNEEMEHIRAAVADEKSRVSDSIPLVHSREHHVELIEALVTGKELVIQVNLPNAGAIVGVADDIVVEGKALVNNGNIQMLQVGNLPEHLFNTIFRPRETILEQTVRAFQKHDFELFRTIILEDHRTTSPAAVDALLKDAMAQPYNESVAKWYSLA